MHTAILPGSEAVASEAQAPALSLALGERCQRRHHLARDQTRLIGELVGDRERIRDPLGGVHDDRHDRDVAAKLEEAIPVRRVVGVEAPGWGLARIGAEFGVKHLQTPEGEQLHGRFRTSCQRVESP
jgi:hypothetical protein